MSNFLGWFFHVFGVKNFFKNLKKYFSNRIEKLHSFFIFFYFFLKFEKVEKTGIISTNFSLQCTPSVVLGVHPNASS